MQNEHKFTPGMFLAVGHYLVDSKGNEVVSHKDTSLIDLFAAAPDLLAALEYCTAALRDWKRLHPEDFDAYDLQAIDNAQKEIDKALGVAE